MISNGKLTSMIIEIHDGKSDSKPVFLKLYRNDKFPWLCPIRNTLFFIDSANLNCPEGYLFMTKSQVEAVASGNSTHTATSVKFSRYS
jgi:hypothetical protein